MKRLLVIGGGLAGLSAAWAARKAGADVRVLELGTLPGGVVKTLQKNGFLMETGPNWGNLVWKGKLRPPRPQPARGISSAAEN